MDSCPGNRQNRRIQWHSFKLRKCELTRIIAFFRAWIEASSVSVAPQKLGKYTRILRSYPRHKEPHGKSVVRTLQPTIDQHYPFISSRRTVHPPSTADQRFTHVSDRNTYPLRKKWKYSLNDYLQFWLRILLPPETICIIISSKIA